MGKGEPLPIVSTGGRGVEAYVLDGAAVRMHRANSKTVSARFNA